MRVAVLFHMCQSEWLQATKMFRYQEAHGLQARRVHNADPPHKVQRLWLSFGAKAGVWEREKSAWSHSPIKAPLQQIRSVLTRLIAAESIGR